MTGPAFRGGGSTLKRIATGEGQWIASLDTNNIPLYRYHYYLTDHPGNVRLVVDEKGTLIQKADYYPFGLAIPLSTGTTDSLRLANKYLYNGKELQPETGLLDYGDRQYGAAEGRWFSIDPHAENYYSVSMYNYVLNNPLLIIDPNGADTMLVHSETGKPIDDLMRKGGEDVIFTSGENGTWEGASQLFYSLNIVGKKGGTPSTENDPVLWRWKDSRGKYKYLSDQTNRFDAVAKYWVAYFDELPLKRIPLCVCLRIECFPVTLFHPQQTAWAAPQYF